jgi:hypothetical protein
MVHACEVSRGCDLPTVSPTKTFDVRDVQGTRIVHHGCRKVPLVLGEIRQVKSEVNFEVSDTAHAVLSLGRILADGTELVVNGSGGDLENNNSYVDVQLRDKVLTSPFR